MPGITRSVMTIPGSERRKSRPSRPPSRPSAAESATNPQLLTSCSRPTRVPPNRLPRPTHARPSLPGSPRHRRSLAPFASVCHFYILVRVTQHCKLNHVIFSPNLDLSSRGRFLARVRSGKRVLSTKFFSFEARTTCGCSPLSCWQQFSAWPRGIEESPRRFHSTRRRRSAATAVLAAVSTSRNAAPRASTREVTLPAGTRPADRSGQFGRLRHQPRRAAGPRSSLPRRPRARPDGDPERQPRQRRRRRREASKVKGRAHLAVRFPIRSCRGGQTSATRFMRRRSAASRWRRKKDDALEDGLPAAGGAIVGGLLGGKKGAAIGGAAAGGAGTAVVLTTRGKEVRLPKGTPLTIRLSPSRSLLRVTGDR